MSKLPSDRRETWGVRRDLNDLFRNERGKLSWSKMGTAAAQIIAGKMLWQIDEFPTWDILAVLFLVLIAPEAYKQMMAMKWGGSAPVRMERTKSTETERTLETNVAIPAKAPI